MFKIQELLSCDKIDNQWVELDHCKSGEIMFSSRVTRKETRDSLRIETTTTEELTPKNSDRTQEFDKLHKKSFQRIVRRTDVEGNIVEEIFDENKNSTGAELSEINISSGIEFSSDFETDNYLNPSINKSSITELRMPRLSSDESPKSTTVRSSVAIEKIEFVSDDDDENLIKSIKGLQESTKTKISGLMETVKETQTVETSNCIKRKVVKSIDEHGNVKEEVIYEGRPSSIVEKIDSPTDLSPSRVDIQLEYPQITVQSGIPVQIQANESHSFIQYFTSSSQAFETINSFRAHFVQSFADKSDNITTESISLRQGTKLYMIASGEPSLDDLNTGSSFTSMMDPTFCNSCIREHTQTDSYMTKSESNMTNNTLDDVLCHSEISNQEIRVAQKLTRPTVDSTPIISPISISLSQFDPQEHSSDQMLSEGNSATQGTCFT